MRIVRYEHSIDPVLEILRHAPNELFGSHYAGYLLFLFGDSDEKFATWFSRRISSLDSITGEFIAGAVFAKKIKIKARQGTAPEPLDKWRQDNPDDAIVNIGDISTYELPQTEWTSDDREIVATTYGSDELATAMGLLEDLPCMVMLDARTPESIEVLRLDPIDTERVIPVFRKVLSRLTTSDDFQAFWQGLKSIQGLQCSVRSAEYQVRLATIQLAEQEAAELPAAPSVSDAELRDAILQAKTKLVRIITRSFEPVAPTLALDLLTAFQREQPFLASAAKTLNTINYYLSRQWPITSDSVQTLAKIRDTYVCEILPSTGEEQRTITRGNLEFWCTSIEERQHSIASRLLRDIDANTLTSKLASFAFEKRQAAIAEKRQRLTEANEELERRNEEYLELATSVESFNPPSVSQTFKAVAREEKLATITRSIGKALASYGAKCIAPETVLKLAFPKLG